MRDGIKKFAASAVVASSMSLSACGDVDIKINDNDGIPLEQLDMSGDAPTELALMGPDTVIITAGDTLNITVEGDDEAVAALRFSKESGMLGIMRESGNWSNSGYATVRVTMPAPSEIDIAGSGTVETTGLADRAEINIAGSGSVTATDIDSERLEVAMMGSGKVVGSGRAERLEINSAGSGFVDLSELKADSGEISIAGSGDVQFASDGEVEASIAGSGDVRVTGTATCTVNALGSGKVVCGPAD